VACSDDGSDVAEAAGADALPTCDCTSAWGHLVIPYRPPQLRPVPRTTHVLPTGTACPLSETPRSAIAVLMHAFSLLVMQRLWSEIEHYEDEADLVVMPVPCEADALPIDFRKTMRLHDDAYADAHAFLHRRTATADIR
jgi:hypothetical protein